MYGLRKSPNNSLMVACGNEVVVVAAHNVVAADNATTTGDIAAMDGVVIMVGVADAMGV